MRWQTTAILAAILIAVGAFYYVYDVRMAPEREKEAARKGRLWTIEPADVNEVTIRRSSDTLTLKREGDRWQMLGPVSARGDRGPIDDALTTIVTAKIDREITAQPASLADFGLDKPAADLTLTTKDGKQLGLQLGAKNPTGVWVYARERDKPAVFVIPDSVLRDSTRPAVDFRDKTILSFERKDVTGLDLALRDDALSLNHAEKGWRITRPRALAADNDVVNDVLDKLQNARVKEFVIDAPRSLEPYGLERPTRVEVHTGKDKDRATKTLLIGATDDKKRGVYALRTGEQSVMLLPEDVWTALPKTVAALRDKTVVAFERDKVTRVDVENPRGAFTIVREGPLADQPARGAAHRSARGRRAGDECAKPSGAGVPERRRERPGPLRRQPAGEGDADGEGCAPHDDPAGPVDGDPRQSGHRLRRHRRPRPRRPGRCQGADRSRQVNHRAARSERGRWSRRQGGEAPATDPRRQGRAARAPGRSGVAHARAHPARGQCRPSGRRAVRRARAQVEGDRRAEG